MTEPKRDLNRLTPTEAERYGTGFWLGASGPRCAVCGDTETNHTDTGACSVCSCLAYEERKL